MGVEIPENPEIISMADLPEEEPEQEVLPDYVTQLAEIGDVLQQGVTQDVPEGWHECDGSTLVTQQWPEFAAALKITEPTFVLPKPERALLGHRWIIKLGQKNRPVVDSRKSLKLLGLEVPEQPVLRVDEIVTEVDG